jgi:hypothetical protein
MSAYRDDCDAVLARIERSRVELVAVESRLRIPDALAIAYADRPAVAAEWKTRRDGVLQAISDDSIRGLPGEDLLRLAAEAESVVAEWQTLGREAENLATLVTTPGEVPPPPRAVRWGATGLGRLNVPVDISAETLAECERMPLVLGPRLETAGAASVELTWEERPSWSEMPWVIRGRCRLGDHPIALLFEIVSRMGALVPTVSLTTSTARAATPMLIVARSEWAKRLFADRRRLGSERRLGDDEVDGVFAVRHAGELSDLPQLATYLRTLAPAERPHVAVDAGSALVRWTYEAEVPLLRASLELLRALREAPVRFSLEK